MFFCIRKYMDCTDTSYGDPNTGGSGGTQCANDVLTIAWHKGLELSSSNITKIVGYDRV